MTDEESVFAAQSGDKGEEERLLNKYSPLVKSVAARFFLAGGESEDLEQEGMVGLYSAINGYSAGSANFSTYAYVCIRNSVVDAVKKMRGDRHSALNNFVPIVEISDSASPASPEEEIILRESRREFLQKISKELSSLEFKAIVMRLDGMSAGEISSSLQKPVKSVNNALSRAKNKLQRLYSL